MDKDIKNYVDRRESLRKRFEEEKTGEQNFNIQQSKLFLPIIQSNREASKVLQDTIQTNQTEYRDIISRDIIPLTRRLDKRIDQVEELQSLPFYNIPIEGMPQPIAQATPVKERVIDIDLDRELLNETHIENLSILREDGVYLDLPSVVQRKGNFEEIRANIEKANRMLGQYTSKRSKKTPGEIDQYNSVKETMKIYKKKIEALEGARQFIVEKTGEGHKLVKLKRGKGRPRSKPEKFKYSTTHNLCEKLKELVDRRNSGEKTNDKLIMDILNEMLNQNYITEDQSKELHKNIFS